MQKNDLEKIIPYTMLNEKYWQGVTKFYLTQSYIVYSSGGLVDRLPLMAYGVPGLYMEKWTSMSN